MPRRLLLLLAAFTVLAVTGLVGIATVAATGAGAQNRVWALNPTGQAGARVIDSESACTHPGSVAGSAGIASGFCVAAEDTTAAGRFFPPIAGGSQLEDLAASGRELDPADAGGLLTRAGRAYAKAGEVFGPTSGGPAAVNQAGQQALEDILGNPGTTETVMQGGNFAGGSRFVSPEGIGAVFGPDGTFQYFGRMTP